MPRYSSCIVYVSRLVWLLQFTVCLPLGFVWLSVEYLKDMHLICHSADPWVCSVVWNYIVWNGQASKWQQEHRTWSFLKNLWLTRIFNISNICWTETENLWPDAGNQLNIVNGFITSAVSGDFPLDHSNRVRTRSGGSTNRVSNLVRSAVTGVSQLSWVRTRWLSHVYSEWFPIRYFSSLKRHLSAYM